MGAGTVNDLVVCESRVMRDIVEHGQPRRPARHPGAAHRREPGTGKEVFARAIHRMSPRSERSFTAINCGVVPQRLLESELFGHRRGFTGAAADHAGLFELAHEGTLLLDEIGDLPLDLQARLLRVLEEGEICRAGGRDAKPVDVRVIAATAKPLEQAVSQGEFRSDLFQRLNAVRIHLPPLRERPEDIPALLTHFAGQAAHRLGHPVSVTPGALAALSHYRGRATSASSGTRWTARRRSPATARST